MRIFIRIKRYHSEIRCVFANDSAAIRMRISRKIRQYVWGIRCVFDNDFATIRMRTFTVKYVFTENTLLICRRTGNNTHAYFIGML